MIKFIKLKNLFLFSVFLFSFFSPIAQAAELKLASPVLKIEVGRQFQVDLLLNAKEESINALEGKIVFPEKLLKLKKIQDGNSIVNFWIKKPQEDLTGNIIFSGITPGGVMVENGLIFSMIFEPAVSGAAVLEISQASVLLNDGQGSAASLDILPLNIVISEVISSEKPIGIEVSDTLPPESFRPEIAKDPNIFNGKYFLAFATQDKGSGMARYEVRELRQKFFSLFAGWQEASSPHLLADQELKSYIFIKAVDLNGNEKIEIIPPKHPLLWYENYLFYVIIISGLTAYILWKILRRKKNSLY
ncbi:MAG: hypothetical protein WC639_05300 [Patescibacteria group bacterium]|jgi:hypothetical protein